MNKNTRNYKNFIKDLTNGVFQVSNSKKAKVIDLDAESETGDKVYLWMMQKIDKHEKTIGILQSQLDEARKEIERLKFEKMKMMEVVSIDC